MDQYATVCKTKQMNMISREEDPKEEMEEEYELIHLIRLQLYLKKTTNETTGRRVDCRHGITDHNFNQSSLIVPANGIAYLKPRR